MADFGDVLKVKPFKAEDIYEGEGRRYIKTLRCKSWVCGTQLRNQSGATVVTAFNAARKISATFSRRFKFRNDNQVGGGEASDASTQPRGQHRRSKYAPPTWEYTLDQTSDPS